MKAKMPRAHENHKAALAPNISRWKKKTVTSACSSFSADARCMYFLLGYLGSKLNCKIESDPKIA